MERAQEPLIPAPEFTLNDEAEIALNVEPTDPHSYEDVIVTALEDTSHRLHNQYYDRQAAVQREDGVQEVTESTAPPEDDAPMKDAEALREEIHAMRLLVLDLRGGQPIQLSGRPLRRVIQWLEDAKTDPSDPQRQPKIPTNPQIQAKVTTLMEGLEFQVAEAQTLLNWWANRGDTNFED